MNEADHHAPESWHDLLLAVAGWIDDRSVSAVRAGEDESTRMAQFLTGAAGIGLTQDDVIALLATTVPGDPSFIARALDANADPSSRRPACTFAPLDPRSVARPGESPSSGATTGEAEFGGFAASPEPIDVTGVDLATWQDQAALAVVRSADDELGVRGVWAALRTATAGGAENAPDEVRVFLVEATERAQLPVLTRRLQQWVSAAGYPGAQVEVFATGDSLPDYQRTALGSAALLWARTGDVTPMVVPVFDQVDPKDGPSFSDEHLRLEVDERRNVAAYLYGAEPVLLTTATMDDVVDAERGSVVPLTYRTDGAFVWPDAVAYYADQYGLAPHPPLLEAIRSAQYLPPRPDGVAVFRAEAALMQPGA